MDDLIRRKDLLAILDGYASTERTARYYIDHPIIVAESTEKAFLALADAIRNLPGERYEQVGWEWPIHEVPSWPFRDKPQWWATGRRFWGDDRDKPMFRRIEED